jgi:hypothetical protein
MEGTSQKFEGRITFASDSAAAYFLRNIHCFFLDVRRNPRGVLSVSELEGLPEATESILDPDSRLLT